MYISHTLHWLPSNTLIMQADLQACMDLVVLFQFPFLLVYVNVTRSVLVLIQDMARLLSAPPAYIFDVNLGVSKIREIFQT